MAKNTENTRKDAKKGSKRPQMPSALCPAAQKLWQDTQSRWEMDDSAALTHLANACRSLTRMRELEGILQKEGIMILNRFKQPARHPAHVVLTSEAKNFREHMAALQLDIESLYSVED
jgi:phage terminase small subunit